jgi:hypothetical protein
MPRDSRAYTGGHFELQLDGHATTAYLKSVDGGHAKVNMVDEPIGPHATRVKHSSTHDVEPFTIECGMSGSYEVLRLIEKSWKKKFKPFSGAITHADFNLRSVFEHQFFDALLTETTFPALDGGSKDAAYLKFKIQPQRVVMRYDTGNKRLQPQQMSSKQKQWLASRFYFTIDGVDDMHYTNKLESFTIKQGIKKLSTGEARVGEIEPTKIEFPNLSGTISLARAGGLMKWYEETVQDGRRDDKAQKTGAIEFLSPDDKTLFSIHLYEVGLTSVQIGASTANQDSMKRVKFELYVGRMELDAAKPPGMA